MSLKLSPETLLRSFDTPAVSAQSDKIFPFELSSATLAFTDMVPMASVTAAITDAFLIFLLFILIKPPSSYITINFIVTSISRIIKLSTYLCNISVIFYHFYYVTTYLFFQLFY